MKKKGLIISTVVMVVVLIAALTTATYAWFTVSNKTTIEGFNVQVVAGNAVNIGVKANNTHEKNADNDAFLSGDVTWTAGTGAGVLSGRDVGTWTAGNTGLGPQLNHGILWGAQSKAVGAINAETNATTLTDATKYGVIGGTTGKAATATGKESTFLNAANLDKGNTLKNVTAAVANKRAGQAAGSEETNGDYAYLFLGASPAETLTTNSLIIMLDGTNSTGTNIGMLAAVHVAYRVTKAGAEPTTAWTEAEFFAGKTYNQALTTATLDLSPTEKAAYTTAYTSSAPANKAGIVKISGLSTEQGKIDQIELIIYIAGSDPDCVDSAKNASGEIKMFFATESASTTTTPADAKIGTDGKLTFTGVGGNDTIVEIKVGDGEWKEIEGDWTNTTTFTSKAAVAGITKDSVVLVRQKANGKTVSAEASVTNNYTGA